jgi:hypothetical protein
MGVERKIPGDVDLEDVGAEFLSYLNRLAKGSLRLFDI